MAYIKNVRKEGFFLIKNSCDLISCKATHLEPYSSINNCFEKNCISIKNQAVEFLCHNIIQNIVSKFLIWACRACLNTKKDFMTIIKLYEKCRAGLCNGGKF